MQIAIYITLSVISLATSSYEVAVARGPTHKLALQQLRKQNDGFENLLHRLKTIVGKRCLNTFDDGCINNNLPFSNSDDDWISGGGSPGKRCINTFDDGCINGDLPFAPSDDSWNSGNGGNPGKRCAFNTFDDNCANGGIPNGNSDDNWINNGGSPGKR